MVTARQNLRRIPARRRGGAAIEFTMSLPVVAFILCLTFIMAWGMKNQQNVTSSSRYATWKQMQARNSALVSSPSTSDMNSDFFSNKATSINSSITSGSDDVFDLYDAQCGDLGDIATDITDSMPRGISYDVQATFSGQSGLWSTFAGGFHSKIYLDDCQWEKVAYKSGDNGGNNAFGWAVRNAYFTEMDKALSENKISAEFRQIYMKKW